MVSDASVRDNLCQEEDQWFLIKNSEIRVITAACEVATAQSFFFGMTKEVTTVPIVSSVRVIIIICIFWLFGSL